MTADTPAEPAERLLTSLLDSYMREYGELADVWKQIDSKAQGTIAVCGIFLAAMLAFARSLGIETGFFAKFMLVVTIALLVFSTILALLALQVREVSSPPLGDEASEIVNDLISAGTALDDDWNVKYLRDIINMWKTCNTTVYEANQSKSSFVLHAQWILFGAIVCSSLVTIVTIV